MSEFSQQGGWSEKEPDGRAAVAVVSGGRVGIFGARSFTTHKYTLTEDVGLFPKGRSVTLSVQSYHAQSAETLAAAKWVCNHPECRGKAWGSKELIYADHGDPQAIARKREAHCVMAVSWLPEDVDLIIGVMAPARGAIATSVITTRRPHGLAQGDQVSILNVMGRHDSMANASASNEMLARVNAAKAYAELGDKKKSKEILDAVDFASAKTSALVPLSVNGPHLVLPKSQTTFEIAQELDGVFVLPADKDEKLLPRVMLRPRRPVLLSDVE